MTLAGVGNAQTTPWNIRAGGGLGVALVSMPELSDYANAVGNPSLQDRVEEFQPVGELAAFGEVRLTDSWSLGLFWGRIVKTIQTNRSLPGGGWEFETTLSMPTVLVHRSIETESISFQVAGGVGPYRGTLVQRYLPAGAENSYSGRGLGWMVQASAFAPLDEHFLAGVAADLRWSDVSRLKDGAGNAPTYAGRTADLSFFHLSLQFLLLVQF
ncbi:MAG: hypothetical protein AABY75_03895 [Bacteroidota bacterium]